MDLIVGLPEVAVLREVQHTTVVGQTLYCLPMGEHFLDAATETEVTNRGGTYRIGDGFYAHVHRHLAPWMLSVSDAMMGIVLAIPPGEASALTIKWRQKLILVPPGSVALVHCVLASGVWRPDYSMKWLQNDPLLAPNAIQVPPPPDGYVVEWWRLSRQKGGEHADHGTGYRMGRRYLPAYRGPAVGTDNPSLFLRTQFDGASSHGPWRHYRICYYNPTTGARSALSSEVIIAAGINNPDQHNSKGPCRYNVWVNR